MEGLIFGHTAQMSTNRVLNVFEYSGSQAVHKEMKQLHDRNIPIILDPAKLSCGSRSTALKYLMFLEMTRDG